MLPSQTVRALSTKAYQGDKEAQYELGIQLIKQSNNVSEANQWLEKAANQGHVQAKFELAKYYARLPSQFSHLSGGDNYLKAASYFLEIVGACHEASEYLKPSSGLYQKLLNLASGAAFYNPGQAFFLLGCIHAQDEFQCKNPQKVIEFYTQAATKYYHTVAANALGKIYYHGELGVTKDNKKAFSFLTHIYQCGKADPVTYEYLGHLHAEGQEGISPNLNEAIIAYQRAEMLGNKAIMYEFGVAYYKKMIAVNPSSYEREACKSKAINYLKKATTASIAPKKSQANNYLGLVYCKAQQWAEAEPFFLAAAQDLPIAQNNLATLYHYRFSPPRISKAIYWYQKAAENHYADAE
ncbi:MAG: hypothetical protein K2X39_04605, partial [Silvanigrellaceae bacterium]|nr:hypothetical protein [Silvanigrellaceae bacterium]